MLGTRMILRQYTPPVILDLENNTQNIFRRGVVFFNFIFEYNHFKLMAKAKKIRTLYISMCNL